ncbi:hypothetical protein W97_00746 [Coniosporium apollinis CBS 100218]|uniref:Uncharacterized protein n=1 Tax=Coniosporium apollinis (strain CBS 100218) TaxID=1168221 RepID=R7YIS7_CONA1|nr:uncharacterized protein W97_00746 [Coniosporium apollinis CBS 100218]EON61531.1 hypothetical protein W97_00746 [Coniosporium apollinis CBS 100218]
MASNGTPKPPRSPQFPQANAPRVWFLTNGASPIAISLARKVLEHGDCVVAGVSPLEFEKNEDRSLEFKEFLEEVKRLERWREKLRVVGLDGRCAIAQCQAAIAEAVQAFGRIDVLLGCSSEAVIGTIEELSQTPHTHSLARSQLETTFHASANIITAVLPHMRSRHNGHIIMLTGITGHLGTPGLGLYCAAQWALEGYCDSLAYEIAPFNIKMTIVQPNLEVGVLGNRITAAPAMAEYAPEANPAPLARELLGGLLDRLTGSGHATAASPGDDGVEGEDENEDEDAAMADAAAESPATSPANISPLPSNAPHNPLPSDLLSSAAPPALYPHLPAAVKAALIAETVHALAAIGGHDNPPARHIVGFEGVASVKEKLKTVSEELEDFIEVSAGVDIGRGGEGGVM